MITVHSLRKAGHKVRVSHLRFGTVDLYSYPHGLSSTYSLERTDVLRNYDAEFDPKGGLTLVKVTLSDGRESQGYALFGPEENYNRKLGLRVALEQALAQLGIPPEPEIVAIDLEFSMTHIAVIISIP